MDNSQDSNNQADEEQNTVPELRRVVNDLTVQALRNYDDGPLTPQLQPQPIQDSENNNNNNNESNTDGDENNLVVLDPDHPLLQRFQVALNKQLTRIDEKLTLETRESRYDLERAKREREELGVELYGLQQELAKHQMLVEKEHDSFNEMSQERKVIENELDSIRNRYRKNQNHVNDELRKVRDLQLERDNLKLRIFYMSNAKEDIRGDIAVIRRATEKADIDKNKFEVDKQRQDMIVNRLEDKESKLREDISLFDSQLNNQMKETKAAREALNEAKMEMEAIEIEKRQLMQNWTNCLIGMKRRDEAHSQMNQAIRAQKQKFDSTIAEIDSYKKSILKEQEMNETLTIMKNQRTSEIKNIEKSMKMNRMKMDLLQEEYNAYNRALNETEKQLNILNTEKNEKTSIVNQKQREVENISQEKVKLEDEIFKKMQEKLTAEKAAQYSDKLRKEQKDKLRELERNLAKLENDIAKAKLECVRTEASNAALDRYVKTLNKDVEDKNRIITKSTSEINQRIRIIEQKQSQIDQFNKKIDYLIEKAGGVELGPLELEEKNLNKEIEEMLIKIMELEQSWLREQNKLVQLVQERQKSSKKLENRKQEYIVLTTKKMRIEGNIENQQNNIKNIIKNLEHLRLQSEKINKYIYKENDTKSNLAKSNELAENEFIEELKAAERESLQLQDKLDSIKVEKEDLLRELIDTDENIMNWERRIQLAKEMKAAVDSETGQGEIKEMNFEIHRMRVRYSELLKQQEKLMRDMETAISRRDTIVTRGEIAQKNPNTVTIGKIQKEIMHISDKIKKTNQSISELESEIRLLRDKQQQIATVLEDKQRNVQSLHDQVEANEANAQELLRQKFERRDELLMKQHRMKYYDNLKNGKYVMLYKQPEANEQEMVKQLDRLRSLGTIVAKLSDEYPNLQTNMRNVELSIQNRLNQEELGLK